MLVGDVGFGIGEEGGGVRNEPIPPALDTSAAKVPLAMRYMGALMMTGFLVVGNQELSLVRAV